MKTGLLQFHRCPFCRRGEGSIGIDLEAAAILQPSPPPTEEIAIKDFPEQPVVIFQPIRAVQQPCPHLVYLMVDVGVWEGSKRRLARTFTWLHANDPHQTALWQFWEIVKAGDFEPSIAYLLRSPTREMTFRLRGGRDCRVTCQGHVICAQDPEDFCEELQGQDALTA